MNGKKTAETVSTLMSSLSAYTNPQQVTAQVMSKMITSNKTKSLIRKIIVDPVQHLIIPHIRAVGPDRSREVFNSLLVIFENHDDILMDLLNASESDIKTYRKEMVDESPYWPFNSWYYDKEVDGDITKIFRFRDAIIYMSIRFIRTDKYCRSMIWCLDFISPTKKVYEYFIDQIEMARQFIEHGYMEKYSRRVKVIQMGRGGRFKVSYATVPNTVIISSEVIDNVEQVISSVNKNDEIREKYNVNKTIGVLLHGPAGTGKSTIVRYLAMKLGRALILTGADDLTEVIDYVKDNRRDDSKFIILIEDIDFKFIDRRKLAIEKKKKVQPVEGGNPVSEDIDDTDDDDDDDDEGVSPFGSNIYSKTDTLFQLLDGVLADSRILVCATTNYKDRLDPALIRDGRFDHDIEVLGLTYEDAVKVCSEFDVTPDEIGLGGFPIPISPASLQTKIINYKTRSKRN